MREPDDASVGKSLEVPVQRILIRTLAYGRAVQLRRQFRLVSAELDALNPVQRREVIAQLLKDMAQAAKLSHPHLYGSHAQARYQPWGNATELAFQNIQGGNPLLKLHGIARWLVVAYFESRDAGYSELDALHRELQRTIRAVRESLKPKELEVIRQRLMAAAA